MKDSRKRRILSAIGAVSCVISMIVSVAVLPGVAYANVTRNPLFAAALAAVTENNNGQSKSGEGGAGKEAKGGAGKENANGAKGETAKKEDKGDKKTEEVDKKGDKKENVGTAKGEAGKDSKEGNKVTGDKVTDNKGKKADSQNPNGGGL